MAELEYAPRAKWFERRWLKRALVWGIVVGVLGVTVWEMLPGMMRRGRMMYWEGRCMEWGEGPAMAAVPAAGTGPAGFKLMFKPPARVPRELEEFTGSLEPTAEVGALMSGLRPGGSGGRFTLSMYTSPSQYFMHGRRSAAGERLIVAWEPAPNPYTGSESLFDYSPQPYRVSVFKPGGLFWDAKLLSSKFYGIGGKQGDETIFAGIEPIEMDPKDEAVFVVPARMLHWDGKGFVAVVHRHKFVLRGDGMEVELVETVPAMRK